MKSCPTCKRTFHDTTVFCLVDGSILDAPFDPEATRHLPNSGRTEAPPTEVLKASDSLPRTIPGPAPTITAQHANPTYPLPAEVPASPGKKFRPLYIAVALALLAISGVIVLFMLRSPASCPNFKVNCYPGSGSATGTSICSLSVEDAPAATRDYRQDPGRLLCSLNPALALQAPALPKTVTNVSWTLSSGKVRSDSPDQQHVYVDTNGLSGREITVTAKVSGFGWRCSNTASTSFRAP